MAAAPPGFDADSGPYSAGKKVFLSQNCFRCHSIGDMRSQMAGGPGGPGGGPPSRGGPGGPGGGPPSRGGPGGMMKGPNRGPNLEHVGKDPDHTVDWMMAHIRNPQSHKPKSRMPAFGEEKINDADLHSLAEYLASLK